MRIYEGIYGMSMSLGKCFFMIEKDDYRKIINRKQKGQTI